MTKILFSLLVGLLLLFPVTDADLGWHLRYGDYFWQNGKILSTNLFSWQMPEYIWANHSWGYDVLLSPIFRYGNFLALSLLGSCLIGLAFYLMIRAQPDQSLPYLVFLFVLICLPLLNTGLKSTYISFAFTALVYACLTGLPQYRRFLPVIFLIWSNLHGQFSLGLGLFLFYLATHFSHSLLKIWLLSVIITLINPWGINLWFTALAHLNAPTAPYIFEWMPWEWRRPEMIVFSSYSLFLILSLWRFRSRFDRFELISYLFFTFLAFRSRRFIPFALLLSFPVFITTIKYYRLKFPRFPLQLALPLAGLLLLYWLPQRGLLRQNWHTYCQSYLQCSPQAATFLSNYPLTGHLFNSYSLGSYLIYHVPHVPVFIDGRMTVWQAADGQYPFKTYYQIIHAKPGSLSWLIQHQIELVVLQPQFELGRVLADQKWPLVYSDTNVVIYANPFFSSNSKPNPS